MAPSNIDDTGAAEMGFQAWIIEDSWEGAIYLEARLVKTWQGLCGSNRLLEDREGRYYWWAVFFALEGGGALQKVVTFLDWESLATELGIEAGEKEVEAGVGVYH